MNTYTIQLPAHLYKALSQQAVAQHKTPDTLAAEWLSAQVASSEADENSAALEREMAAFNKLKPTLLTQYPGQFVAIYQGQVVAMGENRLDVVKQVYHQFGPVVCYVEKITSEPPRRVRIPSVWKVR